VNPTTHRPSLIIGDRQEGARRRWPGAEILLWQRKVTTMAWKYGTSGGDWLWGSNDDDELWGYDGNDILVGYGGQDYIIAGAGNDWLFGGAGNDHLFGEQGNDYLEGGPGADELWGGMGNEFGSSDSDTAAYRGSPEGVHISLGGSSGTGSIAIWAYGGDAEGDQLYSIENLSGSDFNDVLWGDEHDNALNGFKGNDVLRGFAGQDSIDGGDGNDWLYGYQGYDILNGGIGNDRLEGGIGGDTMYGGSGADTFAWWYTTESDSGAWNMDVVMDFNRAEGDLIDLHGIDANDYWVPVPGNQDFTFIGDASHPFTAPGQISWYIGGSPTGEPSGTDTYILLNTDTEADAEGMIKVSGVHGVDASWFVL
jgi:Ca2+-binding RTX toxin-like protein